MDKPQDALAIGRRDHPDTALRLSPHQAEGSKNRELAQARQGDLVEPVASFPRGPRLRPDVADGYLTRIDSDSHR